MMKRNVWKTISFLLFCFCVLFIGCSLRQHTPAADDKPFIFASPDDVKEYIYRFSIDHSNDNLNPYTCRKLLKIIKSSPYSLNIKIEGCDITSHDIAFTCVDMIIPVEELEEFATEYRWTFKTMWWAEDGSHLYILDATHNAKLKQKIITWMERFCKYLE